MGTKAFKMQVGFLVVNYFEVIITYVCVCVCVCVCYLGVQRQEVG